MPQPSASTGPAEAWEVWPGGAPLALGDGDEDRPALTPFLPARPNGASMVVCPGGGYACQVDWEKAPVAEWFAARGIAAFVLGYRVGPRYRHPAPWLDLAESIRMVRARSPELGLDPARVGVIGFSAGGHLAAHAGVHADLPELDARTRHRGVTSRPDLMALVYPVISMGEFAHGGSRDNLLGPDPDPGMVARLSLHTQVGPHTPPAFLVSNMSDGAVPVENSLLFALAMRRHKLPFEIHVYDREGHGFGMFPEDALLRTWPEQLEAWLRHRGFLP